MADDRLAKGSKALLLLAAAVVVLMGLKLSASMVVPIILAVFIATATSPVADWLHRRGIPTGIAVVTVIVGVLGLLGIFGFILTTALMDLNDAGPTYLSAIGETKDAAAGWLAEHGMGRAARSLAAVDLGEWLTDITTETVVAEAPDFISAFVIVLLVVAFILLEAATFRSKAFWARKVGGVNLRHLGDTVGEIQKYLAVKTGISAATGVLVWAWSAAWSVEHAILWGLLGFALNFVPNVGSIIAAIPPIVVALANQGVGTALAILIGFIVINMTLGNVVEPKLMGRALGLSPLVVVLSMIMWGYVLGPIGAVLSAPLTMVLKIVLMRTEDLRWVAVLLAPPRSDEWHSRHSQVPPEPMAHGAAHEAAE